MQQQQSDQGRDEEGRGDLWRLHAIQQEAGSDVAHQSGKGGHRYGQGGEPDVELAVGEQGYGVGPHAANHQGVHDQAGDDAPVGRRQQHLPDRLAGQAGDRRRAAGAGLRTGPHRVLHQEGHGRQAEHQDEPTQDDIGGPPAEVGDQHMGHRGHDHQRDRW